MSTLAVLVAALAAGAGVAGATSPPPRQGAGEHDEGAGRQTNTEDGGEDDRQAAEEPEAAGVAKRQSGAGVVGVTQRPGVTVVQSSGGRETAPAPAGVPLPAAAVAPAMRPAPILPPLMLPAIPSRLSGGGSHSYAPARVLWAATAALLAVSVVLVARLARQAR